MDNIKCTWNYRLIYVDIAPVMNPRVLTDTFELFFPFLLIKLLCSSEASVFDPLGINSDVHSGLNATWDSFLCLLSKPLESASSSKKEKSTSARGLAGLHRDV